jgi:predicted GNAT superfamily acetyltransferase
MIEVREVVERQDLTEAVRLQKLIWGFEDVDLLPLRLFVVATKVGGEVLGAFDGTQMVGFCIAIPGIKPGGSGYWHSHMMGVLPEYRNRGLGRMLKLRQRTAALQRGLKLVEWTFDPLELKNAFFNIERLGAIVRRYVLNQYGTTSSHLHGGLPTDRCVAEWHIATPRAELAAEGQGVPRREIIERVFVPGDIAEIRRNDQKRARDIQRRVSDEFLNAFDQGHAVVEFERSAAGGTYLLSQWDSE